MQIYLCFEADTKLHIMTGVTSFLRLRPFDSNLFVIEMLSYAKATRHHSRCLPRVTRESMVVFSFRGTLEKLQQNASEQVSLL
jgi:hypothetical protein